MAVALIPDESADLGGWESGSAWSRRLEDDNARAVLHQTPAQRAITRELISRARAARVEAFALTGSTARNRRTDVSDLDYHVVGVRPRYEDLPDDIDIFATDAAGFWRKLRAGDDYVQWTLRYGCILFDDTGIFREALRVVVTEGIWPVTSRKRARLPAHVEHAHRLLVIGDREAAQDQIRAAFTAAARAELLDAGAFPLSRSELPGQLRAIGLDILGEALWATVHREPSIDELRLHVSVLEDLVGGSRRTASWANQRHVISDQHGGWSVVRPGGSRVSSRHRTQRDAVSRAREIVERSGGGQVVIHARDGRVRDRDSVRSGAQRSVVAGR